MSTTSCTRFVHMHHRYAILSTNNIQDPPSEEKKPSLIHRILHPGEKDETRKSVEGDRPRGLDYKEADEARHAQNMNQLEGAGIGAAGTAGAVGTAGAMSSQHGIDDRGHSTEYPQHASGSGDNLNFPDRTTLAHAASANTTGTSSGYPEGSSSLASGGDKGMVTEPHTGLPMNVGKYGTGAGGTDGAQQIHGYHEAPKEAGADWEGIRKGNTPY